MILTELLANEDLRHSEFPVTREKIFLAHAGDCPLPRRVAEAIAQYAATASMGDQEQFVYPAILAEGRRLAAQLLECEPEEVAFVGPTSLALSFFASGLKFRRGDNVLIYFDDYPSNVYPWMALAEQGVEVRLMNTRGLGLIRPQDVLGQVDENTRLVALASCHFISGYRLDFQAIGQGLRGRDILFCLDAIQTLGAFPMSVEHVDLLAADAHKWLLGPCGAGVMYVRRAVQEQLRSAHLWLAQRALPGFRRPGANRAARRRGQKYEAGTHNLLGISRFGGSDGAVARGGHGEYRPRAAAQTRLAGARRLQAKGCTVLHADAPPANAGAASSPFTSPAKTWLSSIKNCSPPTSSPPSAPTVPAGATSVSRRTSTTPTPNCSGWWRWWGEFLILILILLSHLDAEPAEGN